MTQTKTIKFFISSTFKDFLKERNALQNFVFPRLKKLCQKNGFYFQPVDLRWGVTEESSEDNKTMEYCLNEVKRCSTDPKPNLLILLGQRYGWGPLPSTITTQELDYIKSKISKDELNKLNNWYIKDLNDLDEKYFLKEKKGLDRKEWETIEKDLKNIVQTATKDKKETEFSHFHTSATEQEIRFALEQQYKSNSTNTIVYSRIFQNNAIDEDFIETSKTAQKNLEKLNKFLKEQDLTYINQTNILLEEYKSAEKECTEYSQLSNDLKYFCVKVLREFRRNILKEIKAYNEKHDSLLKIELSEQAKFLKEKSKIVIGRDDEIKGIKNFIINSDEQYYLLYGKSGSGKTSVMARAIDELKDKNIIYRFIGTTAHTTSPRDTYEYIYWQIVDESLKNKPNDIESDDQKFYQQFYEALDNYTQSQSLTLFIDAVDQFSSFDSLEIFLSYIPKNVKVVFSCLYDGEKKDNEDYTKYFEQLENLNNKYELDMLQDSNEVILNTWLKNVGRTLQDSQMELILQYAENKTPLYLKLAFEIAKEWKSLDKLEDNKKELADTEQELIVKFFDNVIKKHYVKKDLLELTLGLISASKDGLSESELMDILSNEKDILSLYEREGSSYPKLNKLPDAIFSKMYYHMQDIFTERLIDDEMLINPYHRVVEEVLSSLIKEKHLSLTFKIIEYFDSYILSYRKINELNFHYYNTAKLPSSTNQSSQKIGINAAEKRYKISLEAIEFDYKMYFYNYLHVSSTYAKYLYELDLREKVIEVEHYKVELYKKNFGNIDNFFSITQLIKLIKNLSESLQDNGDIEESIQYKEEVLELRYKEGVQIAPMLVLNTGEFIEEDIYGIHKIEVDEYIDALNQLAFFAYKNDLLGRAEEIQQKAIDKCIESLENNYNKYLQKALNHYSDLAAMFLFKDLLISKNKYQEVLTFIQNQFILNKITKEMCIEKQQSVLNGIKLILSGLIKKTSPINLNNLLIELTYFLFKLDKKSWINEYIERIKFKIKILKDNEQFDEAIKNEIVVGKYLFEYKDYVQDWKDKTILHFNNLATGYYNLDEYKDALKNAYKLIHFFDENNIAKNILYKNALDIIKLINQHEEQANSLNDFIIKDSKSRDDFVKVLFILEESLSNDEFKNLLKKNNFTEDTPYDYYIVNSNSEINSIKQYYGQDIVLPALVYYLDGEIEFIKSIYQHSDDETIVSELLELFSNLSRSKYNESLTALLHIAKGLSIKYNNSEEIRVSELFNALHSVELSPQAEKIFRQIFGDSMDQLNEDTDGYELLQLGKGHDEINYDGQMKNLVKRLYEIFENNNILYIRTSYIPEYDINDEDIPF